MAKPNKSRACEKCFVTLCVVINKYNDDDDMMRIMMMIKAAMVRPKNDYDAILKQHNGQTRKGQMFGCPWYRYDDHWFYESQNIMYTWMRRTNWANCQVMVKAKLQKVDMSLHDIVVHIKQWKWYWVCGSGKPGEIYDGKMNSLIGRFPVGIGQVVTHATKLKTRL